VVYGYNEWPRNFAGYLPNDKEAKTYQSAKVVPAIGEPFAWATGTFYERPFKVLGSGGLTITDTSPAYRELFDADELLVPETLSEYYDMMHMALTDVKWNQRWRRKGRRAVLKKHTYRHRAQKILDLLGVE
jgi:spore maturation protein CgeB